MKKDVFLISVDCLRPDYLSVYNRLHRLTPIIDGMAREATVFTQAVCHAPFTTPALASLLTGAYPLRTGVRLLLGQLCDAGLTTMATFARRAGYATGGFPSLFILNSSTGLSRGFDRFREVNEGIRTGKGGCWQTGDRLNAAVDEFLADAGRQPVFCWIHYFDLHDFHLDAKTPPLTSYPRDVHEKVDQLCLGGLRDVLKRHDRFDDAAIILTADHGECLFQHGQRGHGHHVFDSVIRVPLVWRWPGLTDAPRQVDQQVRHVDIAATLLDLWETPPAERPEWLDGTSLLPLLQRQSMSPGFSYAEASPRQLFASDAKNLTQFEGPEIQAVRTDEYKLIVNEAGERQLYELQTDPCEMKNRVEQLPDVAEQLAAALQRITGDGETKSASVSVDPAEEACVMQRLRDLGYVA